MARPRIVRNKEQAAAIPVDQPIQVELPPEGEVTIPAQGQQNQKTNQQENNQLATKQDEIVVQHTISQQEQKQQKKQQDDDVVSLKAQLEQLQKTSTDNERRAREAAEREATLRKQYEDRDRDYQSAINLRGQAEIDAVDNGIAAATAEYEAAIREAAVAASEQDWVTQSQAQGKMAKAAARITQLEDTKGIVQHRIERWKEQQKLAEQQPRQQAGDPVDVHIANMQGINEAQRQWLRDHRDTLTDERKNAKLRVADYDARDKGFAPGSAEYFKHIEEQLGYRRAENMIDEEEEETQPQIVSAPPTREAPSATGRTSPTRVTLTAEERATAAAAGISEIEYARNKLKLLEMKKQGHYGEH